jgi:hypothetical protein
MSRIWSSITVFFELTTHITFFGKRNTHTSFRITIFSVPHFSNNYLFGFFCEILISLSHKKGRDPVTVLVSFLKKKFRVLRTCNVPYWTEFVFMEGEAGELEEEEEEEEDLFVFNGGLLPCLRW